MQLNIAIGQSELPSPDVQRPTLEVVFDPRWQFHAFADRVEFAFSEKGRVKFRCALPLDSAIRLHQLLGPAIRNVLVEQGIGGGTHDEQDKTQDEKPQRPPLAGREWRAANPNNEQGP
jgi:hypothetical protein